METGNNWLLWGGQKPKKETLQKWKHSSYLMQEIKANSMALEMIIT